MRDPSRRSKAGAGRRFRIGPVQPPIFPGKALQSWGTQVHQLNACYSSSDTALVVHGVVSWVMCACLSLSVATYPGDSNRAYCGSIN